jgi:hypothetical protein
MTMWRKYATAPTVQGLGLVTRGAQDFLANPTLAAGDAKISLDGSVDFGDINPFVNCLSSGHCP